MAKFEVSTVFKIEGAAELKSAISGITKSAGDLKESFADLGDSIGHSISQIGKLAAAGIAAAAGLAALATHNAEANKEIVELSKFTGVSAEQIQKLSYMTTQLGGSSDDVSAALKKFTIEVGKEGIAASGAKDNTEKLNLAHLKHDATLERLNDSAAKYNDKLAALNSKSGNATNSSLALAVAQDKLNSGLQRLQDGYNKVVARLSTLHSHNKNAASSAATLQAAHDRLVNGSARLHEAYDKTVDRLSKVHSGNKNTAGSASSLKAENDKLSSGVAIANEQLKIMEDKLSGASSGGTKLQKALSAVSPELRSAFDAAGNVNDKLVVLINGLRAIPDPAQRTALAILAFGRNASGFAKLLGLSNEEIVKMNQSMKDLGIVIEDSALESSAKLASTWTELKAGVSALQNSLLNELNPALTEVYKAFIVFDTEHRKEIIAFAHEGVAFLTKNLSEFFNLLKTGGKSDASPTIRKIYEEIIKLKDAVVPLIEKVKVFYVEFDKITQKYLGFSGAETIIIAGLLQFTGVLGVALNLINTFAQTSALLLDVFKSIPAVLGIITSPLGLFVAAITAAGFAANALAESMGGWPAVLSTFQDAWDNLSVQEIIEDITASAKALFNYIKDSFPLLGPIFSQVWEGIKSGFISAFDSIESFFSGWYSKIAAKVAALAASFKSLFSSSQPPASPASPQPTNANTTGGYSTGGEVIGKGSGTSDSILTKLSNGEFVVKAQAVKSLGVGFLNSLNNVKGYASGGLVSMADSIIPTSVPSWNNDTGGKSAGRPLTLVLPSGNKITTRGLDESVARTLEKELRGSANAKSTPLPAWY